MYSYKGDLLPAVDQNIRLKLINQGTDPSQPQIPECPPPDANVGDFTFRPPRVRAGAGLRAQRERATKFARPDHIGVFSGFSGVGKGDLIVDPDEVEAQLLEEQARALVLEANRRRAERTAGTLRPSVPSLAKQAEQPQNGLLPEPPASRDARKRASYIRKLGVSSSNVFPIPAARAYRAGPKSGTISGSFTAR